MNFNVHRLCCATTQQDTGLSMMKTWSKRHASKLHYNISIKVKVLIAIFLIFPLLSLSQNRGSDFTLVFGDCFHGDSISVSIQGIQVVRTKRLESNTTGRANLTVFQNKNGLLIDYNGHRTSQKKVFVQSIITIQIVADKDYSYRFQLKKGRMFLVEYCADAHHKRMISIEQGTHRFYFI